MNKISLSGYIPGAIGRITELHATYYHRNWNFGLFFESKVAGGLCEFLNRLDPEQDLFRVALHEDRIIGSIAIDGSKADSIGAHLRWFIVSPEYQGTGIGSRLIRAALDFCRTCGFRRVYLSTFAGLNSARHLYEKNGFVLCKEIEGSQWGLPVTEQEFELLSD